MHNTKQVGLKTFIIFRASIGKNLMKTTSGLLFLVLLLLTSCGGSDSGEKTDASTSSSEAASPAVDNIAAGEKIFRTYCITCHGIDGKLELNGAKDLSISVVPLEERINQVTNGKALMTPFKGILSDVQIQQVAEYTMSLKE